MRHIRDIAWIVALAAGCGGGTAQVEGPSAWLGAELHLVAAGFLAGQAVDIELRGATAADVAQLWCERDYEVPMREGAPDYATGSLREVALNGFTTVAGELLRFEIELKRYDFHVAEPGAVVAVIPRDDTHEPEPTNMWIEWEWHDGETDEELFEAAAYTGTFVVGEVRGDADETGLIIPEGVGSIGGFVSARWNESESIRMSFTARCTANDVELFE